MQYRWALKPVERGYQLVNANSNLVMCATDGKITQEAPSGSENQLWILESVDGSEEQYRLQNVASKSYLTVTDNRAYGMGYEMSITEKAADNKQIWKLEETDTLILQAAIDHGTIEPQATTVTKGESKDYTVTATEGYEVISIIVNGKVLEKEAYQVSADGIVTFTLNNIAENQYITVATKKEKYTVCVKNGEVVEKIGEFEEWAFAKVEAPAAPEGMKFAYWQTDAGKIVCYAPNYSFYVMQDVTLVPIYVTDDTAVKEEATILCTASYNTSTKNISFTSKRSLPVGYTIISHGIIITDSKGWNNFGQDASNFIIGASRTKRSVSTTTGRLGTYVARMECTASDTWYGRAYVIYTDTNGEEHTLYSDVADCTVVVN